MNLRRYIVRVWRDLRGRTPRPLVRTKPFTVGCMAMVVRTSQCCGDDGYLDCPFIVLDIAKESMPCSYCREDAICLCLNIEPGVWVAASECVRLDDDTLVEEEETEQAETSKHGVTEG